FHPERLHRDGERSRAIHAGVQVLIRRLHLKAPNLPRSGLFGLLIALPSAAAAAEPTIVSCQFEKMPPMILTFRGGMGADDNTLQVGQTPPVPLSVGSNLM